jgi:hypothetical protein
MATVLKWTRQLILAGRLIITMSFWLTGWILTAHLAVDHPFMSRTTTSALWMSSWALHAIPCIALQIARRHGFVMDGEDVTTYQWSALLLALKRGTVMLDSSSSHLWMVMLSSQKMLMERRRLATLPHWTRLKPNARSALLDATLFLSSAVNVGVCSSHQTGRTTVGLQHRSSLQSLTTLVFLATTA